MVTLARGPGVKGFVDHQHAQAVAGIQQGRGGRVVRGADGVVPGGFEQLDLALLGAVVAGRAQRAVVVVDAAALQLQRHAVQAQAVFRIDA